MDLVLLIILNHRQGGGGPKSPKIGLTSFMDGS